MQLLQKEPRPDINQRDHRGNTPLHIAIHLRLLDIVQLLIANGADPSVKNAGGWSPIKESVAAGYRPIVEELYVAVHHKLHELYLQRIPVLIEALEKLPDFYLELQWEFKSWVPLVSNLCPSDTYRIWKRGSSLKVDTTLAGFKTMKWKRGNISYCFLGSQSDSPGDLLVINHDKKNVKFAVEYLTNLTTDQIRKDVNYLMNRQHIQRNNPIFEDINIAKSSSWFATKKTEKIGSFTTLVYEMDNFQFLTQKRTFSSNKDTPLKEKEKPVWTLDTYFKNDPELNQHTKKPNGLLYPSEKQSDKKKSFTMTVWLTDEFPRKLDDFLPLFEVLSPTGKHFAKLSKFLKMKLPNDKFPVQLEIPVFPTITATVTFKEYIEGEVDPRYFHIPSTYNFEEILNRKPF
eukprot:TRINITY_DN543_c0_g1_i1.p1 TRINITY_DN543_c0_g1~~TRINITY_DN543_c0_g1_i1.p1  ORF type:complete len:402 (-),score=71.72 TRINITY_DN543_c0_g1_i1:128-1333(-)